MSQITRASFGLYQPAKKQYFKPPCEPDIAIQQKHSASSYLELFGLHSLEESQVLPIWHGKLGREEWAFGHTIGRHNSQLKFPLPLISIHCDQTNEFSRTDIRAIYLRLHG